MKKELSLRELVLLGILIVSIFYYFVVYRPVTNELADLEVEKSIAETEVMELQIKLERKKLMKEETEKASIDAGGNPTPIPDYDNANNIINELHIILGARDIPYNISFNEDSPENYVLRRDIDITFSARDYKEALSILKDLKGSPNRYTIDNLNISDGTVASDNGSCDVSLSIFSYEYTGEEIDENDS